MCILFAARIQSISRGMCESPPCSSSSLVVGTELGMVELGGEMCSWGGMRRGHGLIIVVCRQG